VKLLSFFSFLCFYFILLSLGILTKQTHKTENAKGRKEKMDALAVMGMRRLDEYAAWEAYDG
jgi:hypothetical protein